MSHPGYRSWVQDRHDKKYGKGQAYVKLQNQTESEYNIEIKAYNSYYDPDFKNEYHLKPKEHILLTLHSGGYLVCYDKEGFWDRPPCVNKELHSSNYILEWNIVEQGRPGDFVTMIIDLLTTTPFKPFSIY
jgi:hypothetical protein